MIDFFFSSKAKKAAGGHLLTKQSSGPTDFWIETESSAQNMMVYRQGQKPLLMMQMKMFGVERHASNTQIWIVHEFCD